MFLTELKYDMLSHNSLKFFKKSVQEVLSHFSQFATLELKELLIFSIRNEEKTNVIKQPSQDFCRSVISPHYESLILY